jgi:hypothetical protein
LLLLKHKVALYLFPFWLLLLLLVAYVPCGFFRKQLELFFISISSEHCRR